MVIYNYIHLWYGSPELPLHCLVTLLPAEDGCTHLTGMGCLVITECQAFFYNILSSVVQVHNFSFIHPGEMFCYDGDFLHILNEGGLETYTTRLLPSCLQMLHRDIKFDGRCVEVIVTLQHMCGWNLDACLYCKTFSFCDLLSSCAVQLCCHV